MHGIRTFFRSFDFILFGAMIFLTFLGLVTMYSYQGDNLYFNRQIFWIMVAIGAFFLTLIPDYRFFKQGNTTFFFYLGIVLALILVLIVGEVTLGARSRFNLGFFSLQPADPAKLILIIVLSKYFSKRHELIGNFKHIIVSGVYLFIIFGLVFIQPDFGSAIILFFIWFGMILAAGIKLRHLLLVFILGAMTFGVMWQFALHDYQKQRILTFLNPTADIRGTGYNAYQSTIAVGSGQLIGKGIGYGTQSKLLFLPEYETDFIFAAFSEEWGLIGVLLLFSCFGIVIWRLLKHAVNGASNFETLFATGVAIFLISHFFVHIGMNIGLLPVTGTTVPFLSYGGSHLVTEFMAVGMVFAMRRYSRIKKGDAVDTDVLFLS